MTDTHAPVKFLIGKRVYLRPIEPEDLDVIRRWVNDPDIRTVIGEFLPMSRAAQQEWLERVYQDRQRIWFVFALLEDNRIIGDGGFLRIDHVWRTADISIEVGDHKEWGKGYGSEIMQLLLDYGFGTLNLHRISLGVFDFNEQAIRFYERMGFQREGVMRDGYFCNHAYHDVIMMSILEDEYRAGRH